MLIPDSVASLPVILCPPVHTQQSGPNLGVQKPHPIVNPTTAPGCGGAAGRLDSTSAHTHHAPCHLPRATAGGRRPSEFTFLTSGWEGW